VQRNSVRPFIIQLSHPEVSADGNPTFSTASVKVGDRPKAMARPLRPQERAKAGIAQRQRCGSNGSRIKQSKGAFPRSEIEAVYGAAADR
jgi:hypothetical protein